MDKGKLHILWKNINIHYIKYMKDFKVQTVLVAKEID